MKICSRSIYDDRVPSINIDEQGVRYFCRKTDALVSQYGTGRKAGEETFQGFLKEISLAEKKSKSQIA